jgi:opacity protein-like surface antigen
VLAGLGGLEQNMTKRLALLASTAVATIALATPAQAGNFYVTLFGGANWVADTSFTALEPTSPSDTLSWSVGGDAGYVVGGAIGYDLNEVLKGWRTELEFAYRDNQRDGAWSSSTAGGWSGTLDFDQTTFSVMANAWYEFPIAGVSPYIGGGIGWARTEFQGNYLGHAGDPAFKFDNNGFAWQLGAGVRVPIKPGMSMGLGYRYFRGPQVTVLSIGEITGCDCNYASSDVDTENHSVLINLDVSL